MEFRDGKWPKRWSALASPGSLRIGAGFESSLAWYLREMLRRKSAAETACDRFALRNFRRREVTDADAAEALSRRGSRP